MKSNNFSFKDSNSLEQLDILKGVFDINRKLENISINPIFKAWIPKKALMRFFDYGDTQMLQLEKEHGLVTSKIKARKFYAVDSILNLIEKHIIY